MLGRGIVNKHRAFAFHRPSALWIAQIAVDIVFAALQILLFSIIGEKIQASSSSALRTLLDHPTTTEANTDTLQVYFMCGLVLSAGAFFTFVLLIGNTTLLNELSRN